MSRTSRVPRITVTVPTPSETLNTERAHLRYLVRELTRYFPAGVMVAFEDEGETIIATVLIAPGADPIDLRHRSGSDPDWYTFVSV